ncbi:MAG: cystathionine beta-synthase [Deferribacteres bacterium]|nr:cystathionine beta-synthase [candidate division KSB1 bacterium]MCB9503053.1 cystathionine beta-synthase [Deferribacteres bacterium]
MQPQVMSSILETIGSTPLVQLSKVTGAIKARVLAKVEFFNPGGSVKDRIAISMIEAAEREGLLKKGGTIVEATSGNTGAGLAIIAAVKGYKAIFTMPDKMSNEKIRLLKAYGAEVIVCPTSVPADSPKSYYSVAKKIVEDTSNAILANQYFNPRNPEAHYYSTGPEIWQQTGGKIDYFVAGMGTGGTISGTSKYLKEQNPNIKIIGADPVGSILKDYFYTREIIKDHPYKVEGVGEDILPGTLDFNVIDEVISKNDKQCFQTARKLARLEGIFTGGSAGLALAVALDVAAKAKEDETVVVLLPDTGERYLSKFYNDEWMRENRFFDITESNVGEILRIKSGSFSGVLSVSPEASIRDALKLMSQNNISQLPVLEKGAAIGSIEEGQLMASLIENQEKVDGAVKEVMGRPFPVLSTTDSVDDAKKLFAQKYPAILVAQNGNLVGIITKSDIISFIAT